MKRVRVEELISESAQTIACLQQHAGRIDVAGRELVACLKRGRTIFTAGNGGSAAEALHMTEELTGRFRSNRRPLPAICLAADPAAITCIGNDFGFAAIFERQLTALARRGDVLILFTTSGESEDLLKALGMARKRGVRTICLLGRGGGRMAGKGDHEIIVDSRETARIQEAHQVIMHVLLEAVEEEFGD